ncbi:MAG: PLP-dependent transferase [Candidatus Heimdallarchaeota archaeon]|nr:MAG: PLP-dependent transferase [Candidatus Heimdallarchaeota archaeon]
MKFDTKAVHAGQAPDAQTGSILPPIYQTATYVLPEVGVNLGYDYSRTSNPTRSVLETLVAQLEGSKYGIAFSTGMAAIDAIIRARLSSGDHVLVCDDVYGGVYRLFEKNYRKFGLFFDYIDMRDPDNVIEAITPATRLVWIETPTNPLLKIINIEAISEIISQENEHRDLTNKILSVVDNTFMTPYFLSPFEFGADIIIHSTTKYLSGHNQLVGGIAVVRDDNQRWYYDEQGLNTLNEDLKFIQNSVGAVPSPMDAWLTIIGIKTLHLRMERHNTNAQEIVRYLTNHSKVSRVYYPGLESHRNHDVARLQMRGFGGMISFELDGGLEAGRELMKNVKVWSLAESLGAVESMITHPATMTHVSLPKEVRNSRGISDGLVRFSVGIEAAEDLITDLEQALRYA